MGQCFVNGVVYEVPDGAAIVIKNNTLYVDGEVYTGPGSKKEEENKFIIEVRGSLVSLEVKRGDVTVHGDVSGNVDAGGNVTVNGSVGKSVDASGDVNCHNVQGNVDASGKVDCWTVSGSVDASGNVECGYIGGKVDANGNVVCIQKGFKKTSQLLAEYAEKIAVDPNSQEAADLLEEHQNRGEFLELAKISRDLALALRMSAGK